MENNILNMMGDLSSKLDAKNPELKGLVSAMLNGKIKSAESIEKFLLKKDPSKAKEIKKAMKGQDIEGKLDKIKNSISQFEKIIM